MLALGLTSLILVALAMAIDFHWRVLDVGRSHVEEAQLARTLLRRIADDLRGAVRGDSNSAASGSTASGSTASGSTASGSTGSGSAASGSSASVSTSTPHAVPGVYGDGYNLQVDVSRLPDPYQLQMQCSLNAENQYAAMRADVKTVFYFVTGSQGMDLAGSQGSALAGAGSPTLADSGLVQGTGNGLMRCEAARAAAVYAADHGGLSSAILSGGLLAPEVAAIQFEYFDGSEWTDVWDSTERNGLPMAVLVRLYITPMRPQRPRSSVYGGGAGSVLPVQQQPIPYSLLVHLPMAQPTQASGSSTGSGTGDSGTSGTGGTGSSGSSKSATSGSTSASSKGGSTGGKKSGDRKPK